MLHFSTLKTGTFLPAVTLLNSLVHFPNFLRFQTWSRMEGKEGGSLPSGNYWINLAGFATSKLRSVAPDLTTAKSSCAASYQYACRASNAVVGMINVPIEASRSRISSWEPDPQTKDLIHQTLAGTGVTAADEALKAASSFVPGGQPLYRITKAATVEFSKAYSRKGADEPKKKDGAAAEGPAGSSVLETIQKKLQEMSSEMNELKMQNQMLREEVSGLSAANQPPPQWKWKWN